MQNNKVQAMLNYRQVSIIDHADLIGKARFSINFSPEDIAEAIHGQTERSFDDLYYFDFFAFEADGEIIALRRHRNNDKKYSFVSSNSKDKEKALSILNRLMGEKEIEVRDFEEEW